QAKGQAPSVWRGPPLSHGCPERRRTRPRATKRKEFLMRWTAYVSGAGLLLAGLVSVAPAQTPHGGGYYSPYSASPPCATPSSPPAPVIPPGAAMPPGAVRPGPPGAPGAAAPGAAAPGAAAPGAAAPAAPEAAAPATADPGTGAGGERGS